MVHPTTMQVCWDFFKEFPIAKVGTVSFMSFSMNFGTMMLFSFLPFMVSDFFPEYNREQLGWLTGYISSAYFIGSFCGGIIWGRIADSWGRRPAIFLATIGSIIFAMLFGLSQNFWWALITRLFWGVANGAVGVYKTYISEILNNKQQSSGFSLFGIATALGTLLGPVVGGFLSQPADKYSTFQYSFFCDFPFILPILIVEVLNLISLIAFIVFVTESLKKRPPTPNSLLPRTHDSSTNSDSESDYDTNDSLSSINKSQETNNKEMWKLFHCCSHVLNLLKKFISVQRTECILCCTCPRIEASKSDGSQKSFIGMDSLRFIVDKILLDRRVVLSVIIFGAVGGLDLIVLEIFILLMVSDVDHGGFKMTEDNIGLIFTIIGISEIFFILIFYPLLVKLIGYRALLTVSLIGLAISVFLIPWNSFLLIKYAPSAVTSGNYINSTDIEDDFCYSNATRSVTGYTIQHHHMLVWTTVSLAISIVSITRMFGRVSAVVLVNNSCVSKTKGTVNGVAQSLVSIVRGVAHFSITMTFAWSQNNSVWPLNYHFTFILCAILMLFIIPFICCLPSSIEEKRSKL